jgi:hypothetical protein
MRPIEYTNIIKPSVDVLERCGSFLIDSRGLAEFLGIRATKIGELRAAGRLPLPCTLGIGGCLRWSVLELLEWVKAGCPRLDKWKEMRGSSGWSRWGFW